jgi:hypothetical protein
MDDVTDDGKAIRLLPLKVGTMVWRFSGEYRRQAPPI